MDYEEITTQLSSDECWQLLGAGHPGRFAYRVGEDVMILPVDYAVQDDALLLRPSEGDRSLGDVQDEDVAFEIDQLEGQTAWSVVVRGHARALGDAEVERDGAWVPSARGLGEPHELLALTPTEVSGRRFRLDSPHVEP